MLQEVSYCLGSRNQVFQFFVPRFLGSNIILPHRCPPKLKNPTRDVVSLRSFCSPPRHRDCLRPRCAVPGSSLFLLLCIHFPCIALTNTASTSLSLAAAVVIAIMSEAKRMIMIVSMSEAMARAKRMTIVTGESASEEIQGEEHI